jgi:hypothetical protein
VLELEGSCYQFSWVSFFALTSAQQRHKKSVFFIACIHAKNELRIAIDISSDAEVKVVKTRATHENASHEMEHLNYHNDCMQITHISSKHPSEAVKQALQTKLVMLAIKKSETNTPNCAVNVLPCRIQHNGPVNASTRHWTPQESSDGKSNTAYFRGRKLNGRVVELPDGYMGMLILCFFPSSL